MNNTDVSTVLFGHNQCDRYKFRNFTRNISINLNN